jgi:uncharacterized membrane protein
VENGIKSKKHRKVSGVLHKLWNYFTTGMLVLAPTAVSIWVLVKMFRWFDNILGKWYAALFYNLELKIPYIPGMGALTLVLIIIVIGMIGRHYAGRMLVELWDTAIYYIPVANRIYIAIRELSDCLVKSEGAVFQRPVFVQYPRKGLYSIGFITKRYREKFFDPIGDDVVNVFIPTVPNPTSGVLNVSSNEELIPLEISFEDAVKLILSGGLVSPDIKCPLIKEDQCSSEQPGQSSQKQ